MRLGWGWYMFWHGHVESIHHACSTSQIKQENKLWSKSSEYLQWQVAQLWQREPCDCGVLCLRPKSSLCSCYKSGRPCTEHVCLCHESAFFEGDGSLSANISQERGRRPPTTVGVRKLRVIFLSCGIKIYTVHYFVLSQYTHLTDRRTGLRQQYRALHYMQSRG